MRKEGNERMRKMWAKKWGQLEEEVTVCELK